MSNVIAELERRLEEAEELRLARIDDAILEAEPVPAAAVNLLAGSENPLRVWCEHRGSALRALVRRAGISAAMLSEIEADKKEGSTLAAPARAWG
jgi:hypothetical protein